MRKEFYVTHPLNAIRRSIFRPRCDPSKNSQTHKGCRLALMRIRTALFEKYTPGSRFWHKNRGVPRGMRGPGSVFRLPEYATWGFLSGRGYRPAASSQAEAPSVGYLGFRARISCSRCTFCEKKQGTYRISGGCRSILAYWPAATSNLAQCHSFRLACVSFFSLR